MRSKITGFSLVVVLLTGCAALEQSVAVVGDGVIQNPSLGFSGFSYDIPERVKLADPTLENPEELTEIQQLAVRVYDMNKAYHPQGNETFYESFLMFSDNTAFLLVTVEVDRLSDSVRPWEDDTGAGLQRQLLPVYNVTNSRRTLIGDSRKEAVLTTGRAYEKKGWYYSSPKKDRVPFSYEACKVSGINRDRYVLMGFSLPEHEHILSLQMKEMIDGFRF